MNKLIRTVKLPLKYNINNSVNRGLIRAYKLTLPILALCVSFSVFSEVTAEKTNDDKEKTIIHKEIDNIETGLKMLAAGRLDMFVDSRECINDILNNKLPHLKGKVEEVEPVIKANQVYITVSKKSKNCDKILAAFNKGLAEIRKDGTYDKILKKHGMN